MSVLWSFSIFEKIIAKIFSIFAKHLMLHCRWETEAQKISWFILWITPQTSGKASFERYPPKWLVEGVKAYNLKLLTPAQPIATANAKDEKHVHWFQWFLLHQKESQPQCIVSIIKREQWETNRYLVRDQIGNFISASNRQVSSEQCSGYS